MFLHRFLLTTKAYSNDKYCWGHLAKVRGFIFLRTIPILTSAALCKRWLSNYYYLFIVLIGYERPTHLF
jgi:hypothetical protein